MKRPFNNMRVDQVFGVQSSYGLHEGWDCSVAGTWGNQDLGTPLYAVADGEIVHTSLSSKDYGNLVVLQVKTPAGDRWVRYCHCQEVRGIGSVRQGDKVATMGSTGNSPIGSHLHFDVLKKLPPTWRYYTSTKLHEYFEDPEVFFQYAILEEDMPSWLNTLLRDDLGLDLTKSEGDIRGKVGEIKDSLKRYDELRARLTILEADYAHASGKVAELTEKLELEQEARLRVEKEVDDLKKQVTNRDIEITDLREKVESLTAQFDPESVVAVSKEEYMLLTSTDPLKRFSRFRLLIYIFTGK
jgi:septal ring factor EnvC (AmiA/AmiB activator)